MRDFIVYIKNVENQFFWLVKGNEWTDDRNKARHFTYLGARRLQTIHARHCLGAPDPNGDYQVSTIGSRRID